jgi:hypothetical protein
MEKLLAENNLKEFSRMANYVTQIKSQALPLKGLINPDGSILQEENAIQRTLIEHYKTMGTESMNDHEY